MYKNASNSVGATLKAFGNVVGSGDGSALI
jgi:hypothetical protein